MLPKRSRSSRSLLLMLKQAMVVKYNSKIYSLKTMQFLLIMTYFNATINYPVLQPRSSEAVHHMNGW